uniref:RNase H type-1 domain-containing protein n=1 Tax=Pelodiscus sinensis TaxID=13735 RepID=K7EYH5_PELSI
MYFKHCCVYNIVVLMKKNVSPLNNLNFVLYTDGSCFYNSSGVLVAGYASCTVWDVVESAPLPAVSSAQVAELIALTRACHIAAGASATIYTDSQYTFGVVHDFGMLWKQRGFLTSPSHSRKNGPYVAALLDAVLLPSALAIVKCVAHSSSSNEVALGNDIADRAAKAAALSSTG